jgi:hypothetical protein
LNLRKAFENRVDRLCPAFKIGELALAGFENRRNGSGRLLKVLGAATRNMLSNRRKGSELADFKSFSQIQKVFALNGKEFINLI